MLSSADNSFNKLLEVLNAFIVFSPGDAELNKGKFPAGVKFIIIQERKTWTFKDINNVNKLCNGDINWYEGLPDYRGGSK